jgi:hypothetical protein
MKSKAIEHGGAELNSCKRADSTSSFVSIHVVYLRIYYKDCNSDCLRACVFVCVYLFSWTPEPSRPRSTGTNNHTHRRRIVKTGNTFEVYFNCYYIKSFFFFNSFPLSDHQLRSVTRRMEEGSFIIYFTIVNVTWLAGSHLYIGWSFVFSKRKRKTVEMCCRGK